MLYCQMHKSYNYMVFKMYNLIQEGFGIMEERLVLRITVHQFCQIALDGAANHRKLTARPLGSRDLFAAERSHQRRPRGRFEARGDHVFKPLAVSCLRIYCTCFRFDAMSSTSIYACAVNSRTGPCFFSDRVKC